MAKLIELDERKLMRNVTVEVKLIENKFRGIGLLFIQIGCWILGLQYEKQK